MSAIRGLILITCLYCVHVSVALPSVRMRTSECEIGYKWASRMVGTCQKEHLSIFPTYQHTATQESARKWLQKSCANVTNFLSCVARTINAEGPGCNNVDDVMREAMNSVSYCDGSSWVRHYALPNIGRVEYACLDIKRTLCVNIVDLLHFPTEETSLADGLAMARFNMGIMFDCINKEIQRKVSRISGCSASWPEVYFLLLIHMSPNSRLGTGLYPEQIQQLPNIVL